MIGISLHDSCKQVAFFFYKILFVTKIKRLIHINMASNAVIQGWKSRIVGYILATGNYQTVSPNLPQSIAVFAEANDANQVGLDLTPTLLTSAQAVAEKYGWGSPAHIIARILFPKGGGGVQGIPVTFYPQAKASGAVSKKYSIQPVGQATDNGVHRLVIGGREGLDGVFYNINIQIGDTVAMINAKIADALNSVLGCPFIAANTGYTTNLTAKWSGLTSEGLKVSIDTGDNALGLSYNITSTATGSGTPSINAAIQQFGNIWHTIVVNSYGAVSSIMDELEFINGIPNQDNPTGRFVGIVMKPFIAYTGTVLEDASSITNSRSSQVTIAMCPAPLSNGLAMEAAANVARMFAVKSQNSPHLDIGGDAYPDMPTPLIIGAMSDAANRDAILKKGCSTVDLINGAYYMQDFVTTYHPLGEDPPQFAYCRNLMLDFNVRFSYYLLEQQYVIGSVLVSDTDIVNVDKVIQPKSWKALVSGLADDLSSRGLIVDKEFMKAGLTVNISTSNPDRFETFFPYKRSGVVRVAATTAQAGFNFGTLN